MKKTAIQQNIERLEKKILGLRKKYSLCPELSFYEKELKENKKLLIAEREQIEEAYTTGKSNLYTIIGKDYYQKTYTND